jgi:hypothetical protein
MMDCGIGSWRWERLSSGGVPLYFTLNPGWHRIAVRQREVGARVDAVVISSTSNLVPTVPTVCQTPTPTVSPTPQPSFAIPLQPGWNMISLPLDPSTYNPRTLLAPIAGSYDLVYTWDSASQSWKSFSPALPDPQPLRSLSRLQGFWIHLTGAATLPVTGCPQDQATILLNPGWNLVGFPAGAAQDMSTALATIAGKYALVYANDATSPTHPWRKYNPAAPSYANDLMAMEPGKGYWVKATQACTWVVRY